MTVIQEIIVGATLLLGSFLMLVAAFGIVRFPDVFCRMHAAGKAGTMGISLMILSVMLHPPGNEVWSIVLRGALAIFFQFLTTPAATHLLSRASYIADYPLTERTALDELSAFLPSRPDEYYGGHE